MDKLDQLFKKVIDQHAETYDPKAWESLSKRLDSGVLPKSNPFKKWGLPGAAIVIGVSLATWYFSDTSQPVSSPPSPKVSAIETPKDVETPQDSQNNNEKLVTTTTHEASLEEPKHVGYITVHDTQDEVIEPVLPTIETPKIDPITARTVKPISNPDPKIISSFVALSFPSCEGKNIEIKNTNSTDLILRGEHVNYTLFANASKILSFVAGKYEIIDSQTGAILQTQIISGPKGDVLLDEMVYENGLPVLGIHVKTEANVVTSHFGKQSLESPGKDFTINPFDKGNFNLKLQLADENGCTNEISSHLNITEEYNLLAVNAFEPNAQDARKNTFMPYALTQRKTPFNLIILDPNDGGIVFESSDADLPWDGIDKRFGKMVDSNKAYVWKVSLSQPKAGEKSEYIGTVVRM